MKAKTRNKKQEAKTKTKTKTKTHKATNQNDSKDKKGQVEGLLILQNAEHNYCKKKLCNESALNFIIHSLDFPPNMYSLFD